MCEAFFRLQTMAWTKFLTCLRLFWNMLDKSSGPGLFLNFLARSSVTQTQALYNSSGLLHLLLSHKELYVHHCCYLKCQIHYQPHLICYHCCYHCLSEGLSARLNYHTSGCCWWRQGVVRSGKKPGQSSLRSFRQVPSFLTWCLDSPRETDCGAPITLHKLLEFCTVKLGHCRSQNCSVVPK